MSFEGSRATIIKNLSGFTARVDSSGSLYVNTIGTSTTSVSGETVAIWGGSGRNAVYITNQSGTLPAILDASGRLAVTNSGNIVYLAAGNNNVRVGGRVFGTSTFLDTPTDTSGRFIISNVGSNLKTGAFVVVSDASGGSVLSTSSYCAHGIIVSNPASGNAAVVGMCHVGSSGNPPYISGGLVLGLGESREFRINNPVFIRVYGRTSGIAPNWAGMDF